MVLHPINLMSIVLMGALQEEDEVVLSEDDEGIMRALYDSRDNPLVRNHFGFDDQGAFPYSREVRDTIGFYMEARSAYYIIGKLGLHIRRSVEIYGLGILEREEISPKDFDALKEIGKQIAKRD